MVSENCQKLYSYRNCRFRVKCQLVDLFGPVCDGLTSFSALTEYFSKKIGRLLDNDPRWRLVTINSMKIAKTAYLYNLKLRLSKKSGEVKFAKHCPENRVCDGSSSCGR